MSARGAWLGLLLGVSLAGACFAAPRPAVQFSCDPGDETPCPDGYSCEADGCCHLEGSDYAAHEGACQLGGGVLPGTAGESTSTAGESTSTAGSSSGGTSSTASTEDASTEDSGSTAASGESGTTAGGTA